MQLFSVVVPIYKVEKYIRQCIESLINQTFEDIEIILVDDGSPDSCPCICDEYATRDTRIRVIHKENGGVVSARLAAAEIATGKYIACIDADDWVASTYFEEFARVVHRYEPDAILSSYTKMLGNQEKQVFFSPQKGFFSKLEIEKLFYPYLIEGADASRFRLNLCCAAFRRDIFYNVQQACDQKIRIGEDSSCVRAIITKCKSIYIIDKCLYYYRDNPKSAMHKPYPMEGPLLIAQDTYKLIDVTKNNFQDQIYRNVVHELFNVCCSQFYTNKNYTKVLSEINTALNNNFYQECIQKCRFGWTWKGHLAHFVLKYRLVCLMWLYSKIK